MSVWLLSWVALAQDPAASGVVVTLNAYGEHVVGHVLVDADALAKLGITLKKEETALTGPRVPLAHGTRILGLEVGEKQVQNAVDTLLYLDANGDGYLDARDPGFAALSVWADGNEDGKVVDSEVRTLGALGVDSVSRFGEIRMKER